jgi:hypothetical protein
MNMSLNTKLILSVIGIALLATPAVAQESYRHASSRNQYNYQTGGVYPNGATRSGSAESVQSGAEFNTERGY